MRFPIVSNELLLQSLRQFVKQNVFNYAYVISIQYDLTTSIVYSDRERIESEASEKKVKLLIIK